jgi:hypothetical protein
MPIRSLSQEFPLRSHSPSRTHRGIIGRRMPFLHRPSQVRSMIESRSTLETEKSSDADRKAGS